MSILFLLVLIGVLGVRWADRDGRFDLTRARVDNSGPVDSALVAEILEPYFGESLLSINSDSIRCALESIEGLSSVSVTVSYPDEILIAMVPEKPAAFLNTRSGLCPVTARGNTLPLSWGDPSLPVLYVEGTPAFGYMDSGLNLLLKRGLSGSAKVTVSEHGILVVDNGVSVLFDGAGAPEDWETWEAIRTSVNFSAELVDMRYGGQAVIRIAGGEV